MSKDTTVAAALYWGYLIKPDKSPSPVLEQLLLGVANYINRNVAPWDTNCLTPTKLATFYRLVGGDYDPLFLDTSQASLSFIYKSLGCYHTLQPEKDPYTPPTIPALTPQGFVRWQTVQLLLEPDEHVPFLQEAVKRFELTNPVAGELFPRFLPREALPMKPDLQMTEWHDRVSEKLMLEAQASQFRNMPPRPQMALSDVDPSEPTSRPSSASSQSVAETINSSVVDAAGFFAHPHNFYSARPIPPSQSFTNAPPMPRAYHRSNPTSPQPTTSPGTRSAAAAPFLPTTALSTPTITTTPIAIIPTPKMNGNPSHPPGNPPAPPPTTPAPRAPSPPAPAPPPPRQPQPPALPPSAPCSAPRKPCPRNL